MVQLQTMIKLFSLCSKRFPGILETRSAIMQCLCFSAEEEFFSAKGEFIDEFLNDLLI